jgi:hypothetical protein
MFTAKDKETISSKGLTLEDVEKTTQVFPAGFSSFGHSGTGSARQWNYLFF